MKTEQEVLELLCSVPDPEIPNINIVELGIVHKVIIDGDNVRVELTPTYSACPAVPVIEQEVQQLLLASGFKKVDVEHILDPIWTTDCLHESARIKLKENAIVPPGAYSAEDLVQFPKPKLEIACPRCESQDTKLQSSFGSTACKALMVCSSCKEPFEYFKALN